MEAATAEKIIESATLSAATVTDTHTPHYQPTVGVQSDILHNIE